MRWVQVLGVPMMQGQRLGVRVMCLLVMRVPVLGCRFWGHRR